MKDLLCYRPSRFGYVIPTQFRRPEFMPMAIESLLKQGAQVLVAGPERGQRGLDSRVKFLADEPNLNLAEKINRAIGHLPPECDYVGWLGDDDLLLPDALEKFSAALESHPEAELLFGGCEYIDDKGHILFINNSGHWALKLLNFGPQLVPQPSSIWRRSTFESIGGLDPSFGLAFDFDLLIRLSKKRRAVFIQKPVSQFRWHPDSTSVKLRLKSALEASRVRKKHRGSLAKLSFLPLELIVIFLTFMAGKTVNLRSKLVHH